MNKGVYVKRIWGVSMGVCVTHVLLVVLGHGARALVGGQFWYFTPLLLVTLGGVPREQKMPKGHSPRVIYRQVY